MHRASLLLLCLFLIVAPRVADACSCIESSSCQRYAGASAVFVADVVDVLEAATGPKTVRFRVTHAYKGSAKAGATVTVTMPRGSSASCSLDVAPGKRYVILAGEHEGTYSTSLCQGSYPLKPDDPLPALPPAAGQVTGHLYRLADTVPYSDVPIAGAVAYVIDGDRRIETRTDAKGRFTLSGVPQGPRRVRFDVGPGERAEAAINLQFPADCAEVSVIPSPAGRLIGSVLDASGKPVKDAKVYVTRAGSPDGHIERMDETGPSGAFSVTGLAAGSYIVAVGAMDAPHARFPYAPVFHPGVGDRASARPVTIGADPVYLPALRLGTPLPTTSISGEIVCRDGTRPTTAWLTAERLDGHLALMPNDYSTSELTQGRYTVHVVRGHRFAVRGNVSVKEPMREGGFGYYSLNTEPVEVDADAPPDNLRFVSNLERCGEGDAVIVPARW
jgi:hypothetical protein